MRLNELARKKKQPELYDPFKNAMEMLEWYKEHSITKTPNGSKQLFVPRKLERYRTKKEVSDYILRDRAQWAYDDEGNLKPEYQHMIDMAESIAMEGAPILVNTTPLPGGSKPVNTGLWTSTAKEKSNGKWTSEWNDYVQNDGLGSSRTKDQSKIGYLYEVKPNTTVCEIDDTNDAKAIYEIFADLGRENTNYRDPAAWKTMNDNGYGDENSLLTKDFPWQHISRHFDCLHHYNFRFSSYDGFRDFTYGYDCESSAWFKTDRLVLLGQVPIWTADDIRKERDAEDY